MKIDEEEYRDHDYDEMPTHKTYPWLSKVLPIAFPIIFFGCLGAFFYFCYKRQVYFAIYSFCGAFLLPGFLIFVSDLYEVGQKPEPLAYVLSSIGMTGLLITLIVEYGSDGFQKFVLRLALWGLSAAATVFGTRYSIKKAKFILAPKENCRQPIMAQCAAVSVSSSSVGKYANQYVYSPLYKYVYDEKKYSVFGVVSQCKRKKGEYYELLINPEKPDIFIDPEADMKGLPSVIITFLFCSILPALLFFVFVKFV